MSVGVVQKIHHQRKGNGQKPRFGKEDIFLILWGVTLAFMIQVLYDIFEQDFYTRLMPKYWWGISLSVVFAVLLWTWHLRGKKDGHPRIDQSKSEKTKQTELTEDEKRNLRLEYELLRTGMWERNRRMYLADSIVISISLLTIVGCFQSRKDLINLPFPVGDMLFLIILSMLIALLFLHLSAIKVNKEEFKMVDRIIDAFGGKGFVTKEMHEKQLQGNLWFRMRKYVWPLIILIFIIVDIVALIVFQNA